MKFIIQENQIDGALGTMCGPFMFVWVFNTTDAVLLTWCAALRKDSAYTVLNGFWILAWS